MQAAAICAQREPIYGVKPAPTRVKRNLLHTYFTYRKYSRRGFTAPTESRMICPVQQPEQVSIVRKTVAILVLAASAGLTALPSFATGLATCDSGPKSGWQPAETLEKQLKEKGWTIRRIKEDGGCYEVYAFDKNGDRVNAYYHPVTFALIPNTLSTRKP